MKTLLIVYHSMTGGTEQMVHAAAGGASDESSLHVKVLRAVDAWPDDVLAADGYIFATPENLAAMSGLMKDFFDRTYYAGWTVSMVGRTRRWCVPAVTARTP